MEQNRRAHRRHRFENYFNCGVTNNNGTFFILFLLLNLSTFRLVPTIPRICSPPPVDKVASNSTTIPLRRLFSDGRIRFLPRETPSPNVAPVAVCGIIWVRSACPGRVRRGTAETTFPFPCCCPGNNLERNYGTVGPAPMRDSSDRKSSERSLCKRSRFIDPVWRGTSQSCRGATVILTTGINFAVRAPSLLVDRSRG